MIRSDVRGVITTTGPVRGRTGPVVEHPGDRAVAAEARVREFSRRGRAPYPSGEGSSSGGSGQASRRFTTIHAMPLTTATKIAK